MQYAGRLFQDLDPATRAKRVQYLSHGVGVGVGACWRCWIQRSGLAVMLLSKRVRSTDQLEGRSGGARKGTAWGLDSPSWRCTKQNHRRGWREGATDEGKRSDASALVLLGLHLVLGTRTEGEPASALAGLALPIRLFFSTPPAVRTHTHVFAENHQRSENFQTSFVSCHSRRNRARAQAELLLPSSRSSNDNSSRYSCVGV